MSDDRRLNTAEAAVIAVLAPFLLLVIGTWHQ